MNALEALGLAAGAISNANIDSQMQVAQLLITMVGAVSGLSLAWSKQWDTDADNYFNASLQAAIDPSKAGLAAASYAQYQEAQQQGQNEMDQSNNILQSSQSVLQSLGNALDQIFSLLQGPLSVAKATSAALMMSVG